MSQSQEYDELIKMGFTEVPQTRGRVSCKVELAIPSIQGITYKVYSTGFARVKSGRSMWAINPRVNRKPTPVTVDKCYELIATHATKKIAKLNGSTRMASVSATNPQNNQPIPTAMYTDDQLFDTAKALIDQNGQTTTLEVKTELRKQQFNAKQNDVSEGMLRLARAGKLDYEQSSDYRIYKLPDPHAVAPASSTGSNIDEATDSIIAVTGIHKAAVSETSRLEEDLSIDGATAAKLGSYLENTYGISASATPLNLAPGFTVLDLQKHIETNKQ